MPVSTKLRQSDFELSEPADNEFFEREGLDRKNYRREFAQPIDLDVYEDRYIEREDRTALDPRFLDVPTQPSGMGEIGGSGMEALEIDGKRWDTYVYRDGFTVNEITDNTNLDMQRMGLEERADFLFDAYFLAGMDGVSQSPSMVDYLRGAIPSNRTFDLEDYDGDGTGNGPDLGGHEEDFFAVEAMSDVDDLRLLDINEGWDTMLGSKNAILSLNAREGTDAGTSGPSYKDRLQEDNLIQNFMAMPPSLRMNTAPRDSDIPEDEIPSVDLVDSSTAVNPSGEEVLGNDEAFIFPDMDVVTQDFWRLGESSSPTYFPSEGRGGKRHHDYSMRYTHFFNPTGKYPAASGAIHLKNVSQLFGNN